MHPTIFTIPFLNTPLRSYGLMLMIGFVGGTWWATRRAIRTKGDPDFIVNLGFVALIFSIIGARIFFVLHYWDRDFAGQGLWKVINLTSGGLEFYGGFIGAISAGTIYVLWSKRSLRFYYDIVAPSIMFGMCMARIGCFLNGCCWGGLCPAELPWAVEFPYASPAMYRQWEERQCTLPQELIYVSRVGGANLIYRDHVFLSRTDRDNMSQDELAKLGTRKFLEDKFGLTHEGFEESVAAQHTHSVHPSQLYASAGAIILAFCLNTLFYRRKRHGVVFGVLLMTYPVMRFFEEAIRTDNPHDTAGLTISQFVSVMLILGGVAWLVGIYRQPLRSKYAVAFIPPWLVEEKKAASPKKKSKGKKKK